jgi:hypothetical protein
MRVPATRELIAEIRNGKRRSTYIPVQFVGKLSAGDTLIFQEASFDGFGLPKLVPCGDSVVRTLTETWNPPSKWPGYVVLAIKWE